MISVSLRIGLLLILAVRSELESDAQTTPGLASANRYIVINGEKINGPSGSLVVHYGLTRNDFDLLTKSTSGIRQAVPLRIAPQQARYGPRTAETNVVGSTESLAEIFKIRIARGRFLTRDDEENFHNVAAISRNLAIQLFGGDDPIGKNIRIAENYFLVVGVVTADTPKGPRILHSNTRVDMYVPLSTMRSRMGDILMTSMSGARMVERFELSEIWISLDDPSQVGAKANSIRDLLRETHGTTDFSIHLVP